MAHKTSVHVLALASISSIREMMDVGLEDLSPILEHIILLPATPDPDLRPVPSDKLQRNMLSDSVGNLLKLGMSRTDLVRMYFRLKPTKKDKIAESFRAKYKSLRETDMSPDEVFSELQRFAGGNVIRLPKQQMAILAVLAFFFEECDIFERHELTDEKAS